MTTMVEIDFTSLTSEEINDLIARGSNELRARRTLADAEFDLQRITAEAEAKRQELSVYFLAARDRNHDANEIPEWRAPTGTLDLYPLGYPVRHNGKVWTSTHPANSWEPGTTNSQWIQEIEPPEPGKPQIVSWGVGQAILVGDERLHDGHLWRARVAHITHEGWVPSAASYAVWEDRGPYEEPGTGGGGEPPVEEPSPEYPAWSASANYSVGDKVTHNGHLWECLVAHGAEQMGGWAPGVAPTVWKDLGSA